MVADQVNFAWHEVFQLLALQQVMGRPLLAFDGTNRALISLQEFPLVRRQFVPALSKSAWLRILLGIFGLFIFQQRAAAQTTVPGPPRQIKVTVKPEYSALAKRLNLNGAVKVEVLVAPNGKVKKAHVLGERPVLAVDAEKAALQTEFESGPKETTQVLEFRFGSSN